MRRSWLALLALMAVVGLATVGLSAGLTLAPDAASSSPRAIHDYDGPLGNAPTRVEDAAVAAFAMGAGEVDRVISAESPSSPTALVVAAETEAAAGGLPFHDAALEARVTSTIDDIEAGVTRYSQDGTVFRNSEGLLPKEGAGYYTEYTVENSAYANRGVERIVVGANGEMYYTPDHYGSFVRIR